METKDWLIVCGVLLAIGLIVGVGTGIDYGKHHPSQDPGTQEPGQTEKINALYSVTYLADKDTETVAINIFANNNPNLPLLKNKVIMNRYEIFRFIDTTANNQILFAFEGYTSFGKPVFKILTNFQEQDNYISWVEAVTHGYKPNTIVRLKGD